MATLIVSLCNGNAVGEERGRRLLKCGGGAHREENMLLVVRVCNGCVAWSAQRHEIPPLTFWPIATQRDHVVYRGRKLDALGRRRLARLAQGIRSKASFSQLSPLPVRAVAIYPTRCADTGRHALGVGLTPLTLAVGGAANADDHQQAAARAGAGAELGHRGVGYKP